MQKDTPTPTDEGLRIEDVPQTTWYVASFPGYATEGLVLKHAETLRDALKKCASLLRFPVALNSTPLASLLNWLTLPRGYQRVRATKKCLCRFLQPFTCNDEVSCILPEIWCML